MSLTHRLQLLLDEDRYARVEAVAREKRISIAAVIRDAIDQSLAPDDRRRAAAAEAILAAPLMEVPPGEGLLTELETLRSRE